MKRWGMGLGVLALCVSSAASAGGINGNSVNGMPGNNGPRLNGMGNGHTLQGTRIEAATGLDIVGAEVRGGELFL